MSQFKKESRAASAEARRFFLQGAAATCLGVSLSPLNQVSRAAEQKGGGQSGHATADSVIFLNMNGGMSHIDTFDPKTDERCTLGHDPIKTSADGVRVSNLMPNLAKHMDKVCLVNSLSIKTAAHRQAQYLLRTSYEQRGTIVHPDMGAWVSKFRPSEDKTLPAFVKINPGITLGRGFFDSSHGALPVQDPSKGVPFVKQPRGVSDQKFDKRMAALKSMNQAFYNTHKVDNAKSYGQAYEDAVKLMASEELDAFNINKESKAVREKYGNTNLGRGCLLARRLVQRGVRFIDIRHGGWDNHNELKESILKPMVPLDQALAALLDDLHTLGMLERTIVVVATEFGRKSNIDANGGRGHYPLAYSGLIAGGGFKAGYVHGKTDEIGKNVIEGKMGINDFNASIAHAMGLDTNQVVFSDTGRPFQVAHKGQPVKALFA